LDYRLERGWLNVYRESSLDACVVMGVDTSEKWKPFLILRSLSRAGKKSGARHFSYFLVLLI